MRSDKFSDLPDWDDEHFHDEDEEGDEWKPNPTRDACKVLFQKWQAVVFLLNGMITPFLEKEEEDNDNVNLMGSPELEMLRFTARDLLSDAYIIGAKIKSSEAAGIYVIRMENAAIIRRLAQSIATSLLLFLEDEQVDEQHIMIVREEINDFRLLFISWISTFEKDEITDDWGLFV